MSSPQRHLFARLKLLPADTFRPPARRLCTAQFSDIYDIYRSYLKDPDNPHPHSDPAFSLQVSR
jgi:hypothetical protein